MRNMKSIGFGAGITCCIILLILVVSNINQGIISDYEETTIWQVVQIWTPTAAEGNPGANASGFLEIFFMNISSTDSTGYGLNTSTTHETWSDANMPGATSNAWANADNFDITSFESSKTFIIMIRVRYNQTHAHNGTIYLNSSCDTQLTVTCTSWVVGSNIANVSGDQYVTYNDSATNYIWINFVWDNGGTGYQIVDDSVMTTSEIYIEAKY